MASDISERYDNIVEMKQNIFVENDPSKSCRGYPNEEFENYNDCDKEFVSKTLAKHFGPNLIPIWATFDLGKVTRSHFVGWSYDYRVLLEQESLIVDCLVRPPV